MGRRSRVSLAFRAPLALCVLLLAGCGGATSVTGKVTCDGQPVEKGSITFEPTDGQGHATGGAIEAGRYHLEGTSAPQGGKLLVRIRGMRKTGKTMKAGPPFPPDKVIEEEVEFIPEAYNSKSGLTAEIAAGAANEKNFDLTLKSR